MIDTLGRRIDYLRISITDRCNMRCRYCMPDGISAVGHGDVLRYEEIVEICRAALRVGITKFKVTGVFLAMFAALFLVAGCSHNTGAFTVGTRINFGLDPQNVTANVSYTDGLNVIDVSRENSTWTLEIDADNGVSVDSSSGTIRGVKRIRRDVGPQITGYLVDLAEYDPEMAKSYVEAVKYYWQYMADKNTESAE